MKLTARNGERVPERVSLMSEKLYKRISFLMPSFLSLFGIVLSRFFFFSKKALMNFPSLGNMTYWKFRFTTAAARLDHYEIEKRSWGRERRGETKGTVRETPKTKQKTTSLVMCLNGPSDCWITILAAESRVSMYIWHLYWNRLARLRYRPTARRETQTL